jgi:photosystem II stability/assembly factor-like uncharacterized protein
MGDLLVGTKKGLFLLGGGKARQVLPGWEVFHAVNVGDTLLAATNSGFFGPSVQRSDDGGETWERPEGLGLPEESGLTLNRVWHIEPADGMLLLGGDPGCLFSSEDGGATWEVNRALLEHPTRERWHPGAGGMCCHSIQLAPDGTLYVAISAAGAFRSEDGGESFTPINKDVAADFLEETYPEVGQCVHKLLMHPARPERLWQQNHCGVYRSDDRGDTWERLDGNGLPSGFGFGLALDPADPDVAWVVPEEGAENRVVSGGRVGAWRTRDGGASWSLEADGLPAPAWTGVLREAASFDADGVYFGTQSGSVFARPHNGDSWTELERQLPPVFSVEAWR